MTLTCPYCDHENEEPEIESLGEDETDYTACEECDKNFSYSYYISLDFVSEELEESIPYYNKQVARKKGHILELKSSSQQNKDFALQCAENELCRRERELKNLTDFIKENEEKQND